MTQTSCITSLGRIRTKGDRLGRLKLTIEGLRQRDHYVLSRCHRARATVVITMSGGYAPDVEAIVEIHKNTIETAAALWDSVSAY